MSSSIPSEPSPSAERPAEQVVVTFFDLPCLAIRAANGSIYLAVRDLCDAIGVQLSAQLRRIRAHTQLQKGLRSFRVTTAGGFQDQEFLHLQVTATWLLMINSARTSPATRQRLDYLQEYLVQEVYAAFARLTGLPEHSTREIEDLDDLRKIDTHIAALAEQQARLEERQESLEARQTGLEASQDKARDAWRELRTNLRELLTRVQAIETKQEGTITKAQRGYIYQLVMRWSEAEAEGRQITIGAARAACWGITKAKFKLARYEDLPIAKYAECVAFIKQAYTAITGGELDLPEQQTLELE
jgi:P22_AR N-terminal domain